MPDPKVRFENKSYEEMNERQQEIIDLRAKNPDLTHTEIAELHGDTSHAYVSAATRGARDIIQQRMEELEVADELDKFAEEVEYPGEEANANGGVTTVGPIDTSVQYWDERPEKTQLTIEQNEAIENLKASKLEKRVIRAKMRNPESSYKELAEMLEEKSGTVAAYISQNRGVIEEISAIPLREESAPEEDEVEDFDEEESEELFTMAFDREEMIDLLSSDADRDIKERLVSELLTATPR